VKISQVEDSLNFKERLNDGNLWFYAFFSFQWLCSLAVTEDLNLNLIIFKMFFLECVGEFLSVKHKRM
jgi:hypothetical protein